MMGFLLRFPVVGISVAVPFWWSGKFCVWIQYGWNEAIWVLGIVLAVQLRNGCFVDSLVGRSWFTSAIVLDEASLVEFLPNAPGTPG
jgi:hypothetical protein